MAGHEVASPEIPLDEDIVADPAGTVEPLQDRLQVKVKFTDLRRHVGPKFLNLIRWGNDPSDLEVPAGIIFLEPGYGMIEEQ